MKVHAAIARALADKGVDVLFGLLGDGNLFMVDRFVRDEGGTYVAVAHEAGAVLAANGFANVSGRIGVATVTSGPAVTNTVTALVEGVKARTPILVLAGDTPVVDRYHLQNVAQREIVVATGAGFEQIRAATTAAADVSFALRRAGTERRPVFLNMPYEMQWDDVEQEPAGFAIAEHQAVAPDPAALDRAVGIIATARRPIVLAGRGAVGARDAVIRLAERLGAPLATTLRAKDLFRDEPHDLGIFGTLSHDAALATIEAADCVVAFGAGLNKWTTAEGAYLGGKRVVHVDDDRGALGLYTEADGAVVGDARTTADLIVAWLDEAQVEPTCFRNEARAHVRSDDPASSSAPPGDGTVDLRTAMAAVEAAVPRDRNLVLDGGRFVHDAFTIFRVPDPYAFVMTVNFGSIGLGMGNALGAAQARADRPTLLLAGDGGFMLGGLVEFSTACRNGMDIIVVVFNDDSYGAEHIQFRRRGMDPSLTLHSWPDLAPVADALGGQGATVRTAADLAALPRIVAERRAPLLIDVKIDPDCVTRPGRASNG
jgi:thiamine pyrophosphate-dependent acetolactate synthase large subunit-like protein